jgi:hypothetical protein
MVLLTMMLSLTVKGYCRTNKAGTEATGATSGEAVSRPPTGLPISPHYPFTRCTTAKPLKSGRQHTYFPLWQLLRLWLHSLLSYSAWSVLV